MPVAPTDPSAPGDAAPPSYAIGGTLTGLADNSKLVLLDNGGDALTLAANGAFGFAAPMAFNTAYAVTVSTSPWWQNCSVSNGSGTATADVSGVQVSCVDAQAQVSTLAGSNVQGSADGTGAAASFNDPQALKVDASGNVYVGDTFNHLIRKITPDGVVTTFAGSGTAGSADGTGTLAQFNAPDGLAIDRQGHLYVADSYNNEIRKITPTGVVTTLAGSGTAGAAEGTGTAAQFNNPGGIAVDASGNVYVADIDNHKIRKITPEGVVTTLAGSGTAGSADGTGASAQFSSPWGVAIDASGYVYVTDNGNSTIRKISPAGVVTTFAGSGTRGFGDGNSANAQFKGPSGIAVDSTGNVYVSDLDNYAIRKITPAGLVTTLAGGTAGSTDGIGAAAQFSLPWDIELDASGNLYVATNHSIRKITPLR
ncbi:NHL repeat-containing protein [Variovorax soli]|uniref:Sugar lactone lactonase YvrE n=1 Tax=Variovorax soli TaxID=376815 RepID=A0ABU1N8D4_9BURK|nr:NHL repeat-containing protein [Variovorax soli]MDR6534326.1 sugar lactone lactonase YvrE [Variovorax soli]